MSDPGTALLGFFGLLVVVWVVLFCVVLVARVIQRIRRRALPALRTRLNEVTSPRREVDRILGRLPRSAVDRVVIDSQDEPPLAEACMAHALARWGAGDFVKSGRGHGATKWRRIAALFVLAHARHPELLEVLREALHDPHGDVAEAAMRVLGRLRDRRAAALLIDVVGDAAAASRVAAVLDTFPLAIPDLLCPLTRHPRPVVRFWAASLLGRYAHGAEVAGEIRRLVGDVDPRVRKAAVQALGKVGSVELISVAGRLVDDPVFYVRAHAIRALGMLGQPHLAECMARALGDSNWWVRLAAKESLTAMGADAGPAVIPYLDSADHFVRDAAAEVLQNIGCVDGSGLLEADVETKEG